jgi:hypothetical protein
VFLVIHFPNYLNNRFSIWFLLFISSPTYWSWGKSVSMKFNKHFKRNFIFLVANFQIGRVQYINIPQGHEEVLLHGFQVKGH